ncbi:MAG: glyoxylate/hydroxypyruvate reductase A [Alphaproteobacteria bacterium]|nr:glyoxylate/hydroxypyruvate reductase A [Alphaproteobacteria bacterium]
MSIVLVHIDGEPVEPWIAEFTRQAPEIEARPLDRIEDPAAVDVVVAWKLPQGLYGTFPNLRLIQSMAAGVDHVLADTSRPAQVPIARVVDPWMARAMSHHVILQILRWHRQLDLFEADRAENRWRCGVTFHPETVRVGVLGLGHLGQAVARALQGLGFAAAGWSRSPKALEGLETFHGTEGLAALAERSTALVCLLPLTTETEGILNAGLFAHLPEGSFLVNVARGGHLVEDDLFAALDSGRLSAAALDVMAAEPLPSDHPAWRDPRIFLTPHIASEINLATATTVFVDNIRRLRRGEALTGLVDPARGY